MKTRYGIIYPTTKTQEYPVGKEERMFRLAICDDTLPHAERLAAEIRSCLANSGSGLAIDCFATLAELRKAVKKDLGKYRLVVLETEVDADNGVDTARELRKMGYLSDIVFYTADPTKALEAYAAYPLGYILKPCGAADMCDLISFVAERNSRKPSIILNGTDGRKNGFRVDDIIYIEVFRTELEVHCVSGKTTCTGSLREVCEKLPANRFYRSHRSFIVNLGRVQRIEKYQFTMDNGDVVAVAKNRYAEAKKAWRDFL